jgi:hypothetical protein
MVNPLYNIAVVSNAIIIIIMIKYHGLLYMNIIIIITYNYN